MIELLMCCLVRLPSPWLQEARDRIAEAEHAAGKGNPMAWMYWDVVWHREEVMRVHCMPTARGGEHLDRRKDKV